MSLPGTYANGFAPRDGEPLYPSLWRGCVGAWNPGLGPSGLTLRDWSGRGNHGTLTNMDPDTDWVLNAGSRMIDFDGSNDYIETTFNPSKVMLTGYSCSVSCWVKQSSSASRQYLYGIASPVRWFVYIEATTRVIAFAIGNANLLTGSSFPSSGLHHLAIAKQGAAVTVYIDGIISSTNSYAGNDMVPNLNVPIGALAGPAQTLNGMLGSLSFYNRALNDREVSLLSMRPGIAYELAPRRRFGESVAAFNRRRRLLTGAA
jgi:hypothetical protein